MTKINDLRGKSETELKDMLLDLRKEQLNMRFQRATGQLANTAHVRVVRRDIARVETLLHTPKGAAAGTTTKKSAPAKKAKAAAK